MFDTMPSSIEHIRAGKLRPLAVTTAARSEALPGVPTVAEFVPGYEASAFSGIGAPKNTPDEIIVKLNKEINAGLADAKMKAQLTGLGAVLMPMTPAEFGSTSVSGRSRRPAPAASTSPITRLLLPSRASWPEALASTPTRKP